MSVCVCPVLPVCTGNSNRFYCHVFRCVSEEKAYALALAVAKAFYLAYQVT